MGVDVTLQSGATMASAEEMARQPSAHAEAIDSHGKQHGSPQLYGE